MLFNYNKLNIFIITFIITTLIFFCVNNIVLQYTEEKENETSEKIENIIQIQEKIEEIKIENNENKEWSLKIPSLNLCAQVREGTEDNVLQDFIGHFDETSKWEGNVGLAAHNRGYKNNFFEGLKDINLGDEIQYFFQGKNRNYQVNKKEYILNTDWSSLIRTKENQLTLITCVQNQPQYRLCVQAIEI